MSRAAATAGFPRARSFAGILVACCLATASTAAEHGPKRWSKSIQAAIELGRVDADAIDLENVLSDATEHADQSGKPSRGTEWVASRIFEAGYGEIERGAVHDDSARYALPMQLRVPRLLTNGIGTYTHKGFQHYCFDFLTRIGDPIVAARPGTVARVVDDHPNGVDTYNSFRSNLVSVRHEDGTFAQYAHLSPGIPVKVGQKIRRREVIAKSGYSGGGNGEHLHFCVFRFDQEGWVHSTPIRFGRPGTPGFVPKAGVFYGRKIKASKDLRVSVDGRPVGTGEPLSVAKGSSNQLKVELRSSDGTWQDVTHARETQYEPLTLWNVSAAATGRVTMMPSLGFAHMEVAEPVASVLVMHRRGKGLAERKVSFRLR